MPTQTGYEAACSVEERGRAIILPFLKSRSHDGQLVVFNKGALMRHVQERIGDFAFNSDADRFYTVEMKVEQTHTGNLFLETWSNKNLENRQSHFERGSNPGWMLKSTAELLFYYFLDNDHLYIIDLLELQRWAFGVDEAQPQMLRPQYREVRQGRYHQRNDTWGRLVPIYDIRNALTERHFKLVYPKQIEMFEAADETGLPEV